MKYFFALLLISSASFGKTRMPDTIKCTSKATSENVRSFSLIDLNTLHPDSTIVDAGLMGYEIRDGYMFMGMSNQCDNSYDIKIPLYELELLIQGKRKTVTGELKYADVPLMEAHDSEEAVEETVEITCRLK